MSDPSSELSRLAMELSELRRQARDRERRAPRFEHLKRGLETVRRERAAGESPALRAVQDHIEKQFGRYRGALRHVHEIEVNLDKLRISGHADLIDATPAVAAALAKVADRERAVQELLQRELPTASTRGHLVCGDRERKP